MHSYQPPSITELKFQPCYFNFRVIVSYLMTTLVVNPKKRAQNIEGKVNAIGRLKKRGMGGLGNVFGLCLLIWVSGESGLSVVR